jgi:hypothetical protein
VDHRVHDTDLFMQHLVGYFFHIFPITALFLLLISPGKPIHSKSEANLPWVEMCSRTRGLLLVPVSAEVETMPGSVLSRPKMVANHIISLFRAGWIILGGLDANANTIFPLVSLSVSIYDIYILHALCDAFMHNFTMFLVIAYFTTIYMYSKKSRYGKALQNIVRSQIHKSQAQHCYKLW